ncbi:hypothetical protein ES702_01710 [subsurface metagenome]
MNERGYYFTQPDGQGVVFSGDVGVLDPSRGETVARTAGSLGTRTPITRTRTPLRKIGGASPGWWEDLKSQLGKVPTWAWLAGGAGLVLLLVVTKGEKGTWLQKV